MDFVRLEAATPGLGYASDNRTAGDGSAASATARQFADPASHCPSDDGLWLVNLESGDSRLLVSYRELLDSVARTGRWAGRRVPAGRCRRRLLGRRQRANRAAGLTLLHGRQSCCKSITTAVPRPARCACPVGMHADTDLMGASRACLL